jgi:DNA-binding transcriptional ArsR family regulator
MKKETLASGSGQPSSLAQLRALAHPLRLRMLELFAEAPRTTKQVAQLLGEPPTRLYHHANALERAGLLRLAKTRQNRGAVEKWYEASASQISGRRLSRSRPMLQAISGLAAVALDETRREVAVALSAKRAVRPLIIRVPAVGSEREIAAIRKRLLQFLKQLRHEKSGAKGHGEKPGERDLQRWALTIAFAPTVGGTHLASGRPRGTPPDS